MQSDRTATETTKHDKTKAKSQKKNRLRRNATLPHGLDRTRIIIIITIKPELHNTLGLHCRQRGGPTEPRATCTENLVNLGACCFWDMRADRHVTYSLIAIVCINIGDGESLIRTVTSHR